MTDAKRMVVMVVFAAALAPILSACGGDGGSCGKVQPCGGDVVGSYTISAACFSNAVLDMQTIEGCPEATISVTSLSVTGNATFGADMTYSASQTTSISASQTLPASCLTMGGLTLTCMQVDQLFQQLLIDNPGTFQSVRCSGSGSCTCTFALAPMTISETGTYTTSGTTLTLTDSAGGVSGGPYCVQGNELHLVSLDMAMPMNIQADTVLTKR